MQREKIIGLNADVMVLTETHRSISLPNYMSVVSRNDLAYHNEGESCVAIWSRLPLTQIATDDRIATVCVELQSPLGPMLIYGTIITYADDGVWEGFAQKWDRHRQAVQQQTSEWKRLRDQFPQHLLCIAGDFNMNLDGRHWYGVKDAKEAVLRGLDDAKMYCRTTEDFQKAPYNLSRSTVDHICLPNDLELETRLELWEGEKMSDHNGVLVEFTL